MVSPSFSCNIIEVQGKDSSITVYTFSSRLVSSSPSAVFVSFSGIASVHKGFFMCSSIALVWKDV